MNETKTESVKFSTEMLTEETIRQVQFDIKSYYLDILGNARRIASDEQTNKENLTITKSIWTTAKWKTQFAWGSKKKPILYLLDFLLLFGPIIFGYGLTAPSQNWYLLTIGVVITSFVFILRILNEQR